MINTIQALELCQRVLRSDGSNNDAISVRSYVIAFGLNEKVIDLPDNVAASYGALATEHGLNFVVDIDGNQT